MGTLLIKPRKALNKAFLKVKPKRTEIEHFKNNLSTLLDRINDNESEEYHKNLVSEFLKDTYYKQNHFINTKGRNDLVIHNASQATSSVGVIIEAKKPTNKSEMISKDKINVKAFHELVLYYLRERITHKNIEIKHLIVTNINEWYIFDAILFDRIFAQNKYLVKQFNDFEGGRLSDTTTEFFYKNIAEQYIEEISLDIEFTYFDIREFEKPLRNKSNKDDNVLVVLHKIFSPEHLLKLPFANDSNSLDKRFYAELLHIIGLAETKDGSKKVIGRKIDGRRDLGSIIENCIIQLDSLDKISRIPNPSRFGSNTQERLFNVALELSITWINRILFLKLLEGQLISYHRDDKSYEFLNSSRIKNYDDLNSLFFQVLARKYEDRTEDVKFLFSKVPYLNSSLFEPTEIEHHTIFISNLRDDKTIPLFPQTVLKNESGKRISGEIGALDYLFRFLNAYDFSSEGSEDIQEDNKTLINSSVLGLIFEKINGYKDGSFFTPGFITMYMCRETIRKAVVQKFNDVKGWNCVDLNSLYNQIENRSEANEIINDLKICDPAVGSGHFLVSALNEIIAVKNDLKILQDRNGKRLKEYQFDVVNDELIVTDEDGELFKYIPTNIESQRIQETLFHEKQTIIENCLFGVDINPNSVKICRLRLWIELLKNAYYKNDSELETLPNIDINIKCGNSLVSRFSLDSDLKSALKKSTSKWSIDSYRNAVSTYRNAENKDQKRTMERLIDEIKNNFQSEISQNDPKLKKLRKLRGEIYHMSNQGHLFELTLKEKKNLNKKITSVATEIKKLENDIDEITNNKIFENAFEWRFEFPEVLNNDGDFIGFDVVIGNPPYIPLESFNLSERIFFNSKYTQLERKYETSIPFIIEGLGILNANGTLSYIAPITWQTGENYSKFRRYIIENQHIEKIINLPFNIFEDAYVDTGIYFFSKNKQTHYFLHSFEKKSSISTFKDLSFESYKLSEIVKPDYKLFIDKTTQQFSRLNSGDFTTLGAITKSTQGLSGSNFPETHFSENENVFPFLAKGNVYNFCLIKENIYNTDLSKKSSLQQYYLSEPKILIRRIINRQDRLSVTYFEERLVFKKDINPFIPIDPNFDCKFLTGILASKFISYLYLNSSSIAMKDDFRQTTLTELRKLPIPIVKSEEQKKISNIVSIILENKQNNPNCDTSDLENQLDNIIYQLYNLTEKEIQIIENKREK